MAHSTSNLTLFTSITALTLGFAFGCEADAPKGTPADTKTTTSAAGAAPSSSTPLPTVGGSTGASTPASSTGATKATGTDAAAGATSAVAQSSGGATSPATMLAGAGTSALSTTTTGGTTYAIPDFDGVPTVGDSAPNSSAGAPAGTVTAVSSSGTSAYKTVTIRYPAEWQCPASATTATLPASAAATPATTSNVALAPTDCHGLAALRRPALKAESLAQLTVQRTSLIASKCLERTETRCIDANGKNVSSSNCYQYRYANGMGGAASYATAGSVPSASTADKSEEGATEYSTTNTQVATVDEADYVKNDGQTIFVLGADGLHVIDAWPASETHELTLLPITGEPRRLFLSDNRLVVYTRVQAKAGSGMGSSNPSDQGCTYGYDCRFTSEGGHSMAIVYDVSAPAQPRELVRYETSGGFVAARRVSSFVYTVVHDTGAPQLPGLDYTLTASSYETLEAIFAARVATNDALIDSKPDDYFLPWVQTTLPDGTTKLNADCGQALVGSEARGMSFVSVNAFDLTKLEVPTRTVVGSNPGYVYGSPEALYLAVDQVPEPTAASSYYYYGRNAANSIIHKFALSGTETKYKGSVSLTGHILNQFAMDERQGVLRVASTAGWVPSADVISYLTTFGESGGTLKQLGQIGGIAPTEDIRSVRFDDDRGFVVTFKKTDPLFVFDLTDPANPRKMGELKIPGFSTYMHRLDRDHLMAVGFEADDQGSYAYFNGIQIQIFDVTDLTNPTLMHKRVIGTRGSGSEALTNHLAFNYFAPKKMLALPITVCEGGGNGSYGNNLTFAGLMAFDISLESGITEHGRLPFLDPSTLTTGGSCSKWWTDSTSLVKRSIFMDDWVYGLSDAQLRVASLSSMSQPAAILKLVK